MDIEFADTNLIELCNDERVAKRKFNAALVKQLHHRLMDIRAAPFVTNIIGGKPHPLEREREGQFALTLVGLYRLVFEPANNPIPRKADGKIDWSNVNKVRIVYIGDYHDY
jgi:toxin HigB-1